MADHDEFFAKADELARGGQPFATATVVRVERPTSGKPGDRSIITLDGELHGWIGGSCSRPTVVREAVAALRDGHSRLIRLSSEQDEKVARDGLIDLSMTCYSGGTMEIFIEPHAPSPRLLILGDQPVARALAGLAKAMGYRVVGVLSTGSLTEADEQLDGVEEIAATMTPLTFVVVATHGESDEIALEAVLETSAPYVGLVASRKRARSIRRYLGVRGLGEDDLAALRAPAGLDIGAQRPEEIALSILAEVVETRRALKEFQWEGEGERERVSGERSSATAIDPICGMTVQVAGSRHVFEYQDEDFHFCCAGCLEQFAAEPEEHLPAADSLPAG